MNPEAQAIFDEILKKEIDDLSEDDKIFLRARRSYLKKAQVEEYDSVLNPKIKNQTSAKTETVKEHGESQTTN